MNQRILLIVGLTLPLLALSGLIAHKESIIRSGKEFTLKITGFDPRDLLSGHYITYRIDYGVDDLCNKGGKQFICLQETGPHYVTQNKSDCDYPVQGYCRGSQFDSGLERFYIPQADAMTLDKAVRTGDGSLVISVTHSGHKAVKELLIKGERWQSEK
jgi:hypothetical protein